MSLSFEQEVNADADAQEDYRTLRAREAENIPSVKVVEHGRGNVQQEVAHPFHPLPSPLPNGVIGVRESASTTSGSYPLQSEVHSIVNSNFGALQDVAQPAAQLAAVQREACSLLAAFPGFWQLHAIPKRYLYVKVDDDAAAYSSFSSFLDLFRTFLLFSYILLSISRSATFRKSMVITYF